MKKYHKLISCLLLVLSPISLVNAQCGAPVSGGSSSNLFTLIRNSTNPVAVDKTLNTVVYIHRNNATAFGGNSGQLRYDVSFNAGVTWTLDQGVLNPLTPNLGRYPNVAIYNPTNNTVPSNAYLGYLAATINSATSAWNGVVTGGSQLNSLTSTENYNQPLAGAQLIPHSLVRGAPGIFWSVDALYNGTNITGFTIYKGQWNTTLNDIVWSNNFTVTPNFNTGLTTIPNLGDYNIAFDPTGTNGWFSFLGHVSPGPSNYALYPVFYKTTNGGVSWTGPIQVDLNNFSCLTANTPSPSVVTTNFEHDLTVDVNGNPHLFTTICNGSNAYGVFYTQWHHMYDITLKNNLWVAYDVANVQAGRGSWGISPNIVTQDMSPQVARSEDGTKIFFTWTDNSTYSLGQANLSPNLFGKAYNVSANTWTPIKDFTSCNAAISGSLIVPHLAAEVLEPTASQYKLAPVYGLMTTSDPTLIANFNFLDNVTFSSSEFTVNPPPAPVLSIAQGTNVLLCPGSTISVNLTGSVGQALWSTGSTATALSISSPTITTYSVVAQQSCNVGTASLVVTNMSVTATGPTASLCEGSQATLNVVGNALSYSWAPGSLTGTNILITTSTAVPIYTVSAGSNANCVATVTVGLNVLSLPTVTISGSNTVCVGSLLTLTANGAANYTWSSGAFGNTVSILPTPSIMCLGEDINGCQNSDFLFIQTVNLPNVVAVSSQSAVCLGGSVIFNGLGATTYTWSNSVVGNTVSISPTGTSVYTVTGEDITTCTNTATLSVIVNPLPQVSISSSRSVACLGERAIISVTGAISYLWNNGITSSSILTTPTANTSYTITGTDINNCVNTATYTQVVSQCLGLNEKEGGINQPLIYPNPSQGEVTIKSNSDLTILVVNELGQVMVKTSLTENNNFELKFSKLAAGVYFVMYEHGGIQKREKLIVQH